MSIPSIMYIAIALIALAILAAALIYKGKTSVQKRTSRLVVVALFLVIAGIVFGEDRLIGYSLIVCGVLLCILDIILYRRTRTIS